MGSKSRKSAAVASGGSGRAAGAKATASASASASASATAMAPAVLGSKEQALFRSVVKLYETKQYKKAIKVADQILKKHPNHGETLAMKGLTLSCVERKTEAYELVRAGLRADMRSHVCWHVYGLLYRADRDYREASKAYLQALRIDKDNLQILRDLALLQVQSRDLDGFEASRRKLLTLKPNQKNNWTGLAIAHHLRDEPLAALNVLDVYDGTLKDGATSSNSVDQLDASEAYETSELELYKAELLAEAGEHEQALERLTKCESKVVDRLAWKRMRVDALLALERYDEADRLARELLTSNAENREYLARIMHVALARAGVLAEEREPSVSSDSRRERGSLRAEQVLYAARSPERDAVRIELCDALAREMPDASGLAHVAMELSPAGVDFKARADRFVRPFLLKGVPSLFSAMKNFYKDHAKASILGELFESYHAALETQLAQNAQGKAALPALCSASAHSDALANGDAATNGLDSHKKLLANDETLMGIVFYLVQHYDKLDERERALELAQSSVDRWPECIDLRLALAKTLKHVGERAKAVEVLDAARKMDLADRYLNHKCAKYAIQADQVTAAEEWVALFTRDGDLGGIQALYDMQCMWYETEAGDAFMRLGEYSKALKRYTAVMRHFADILEDQFDFHTYCLRKMTLRSYVDTLRMEDRIRSHRYFSRAAKGLVRLMLALEDQPLEKQLKYRMTLEEAELQELTAAERKKVLAKRRKAEAKTNAALVPEESATSATGSADGANATKKSTNKSASTRAPGWMELDPEGRELLRAVENYNAEASKYVRELECWGQDAKGVIRDVEIHRLAFEVALRREEYMIAFRAVLRANTADANNPDTIAITARWMRVAACAAEKIDALPESAKKVLVAESDALMQRVGTRSALEYVSKMDAQDSSAHKRLELGFALLELASTCAGCDEAEAAAAKAEATRFLERWSDGPGAQHVKLTRLEYIARAAAALGCDASAMSGFFAACAKVYPCASAFQS